LRAGESEHAGALLERRGTRRLNPGRLWLEARA